MLKGRPREPSSIVLADFRRLRRCACPLSLLCHVLLVRSRLMGRTVAARGASAAMMMHPSWGLNMKRSQASGNAEPRELEKSSCGQEADAWGYIAR